MEGLTWYKQSLRQQCKLFIDDIQKMRTRHEQCLHGEHSTAMVNVWKIVFNSWVEEEVLLVIPRGVILPARIDGKALVARTGLQDVTEVVPAVFMNTKRDRVVTAKCQSQEAKTSNTFSQLS